MPSTPTLVSEKLDQAVEILREQDVDLWITLVRETMLTSDPCLELVAGTYSAWTGAFIVSASGERVAIVGRFDVPAVEQVGAYEVTGYDPLTAAALSALDHVPPRIDSRYVFTTSRKCPGRDESGPFDVANFRRRTWGRRSTQQGLRSQPGRRS